LAAQQTRDVQRAPTVTGTASVTGTATTDEQVPQPVKRARVELSAEGRAPVTEFTDDRGRFTFSRVPAGRYTLVVSKPGFVRMTYGARRPDRPGTPITVNDNQQVSDLAIRIPRGAVITGTIRDESGQAAPGIGVRVMQYRTVNGERTLAPAPAANGADTTDDLGAYRLYGLPAGDYVVTATPRLLAASDIRQMTPSDIQSAQQAMQQGAGINAGQAPRPDPTTVTYAPVFYPGTTNAGSAAMVTVAAGEERAGVDLSLQLVRTARIEGTVVTPNGVPPQTAQLFLVPRTAAAAGLPAMVSFNRIAVGPDGKFSYPGVAPGQYTVSARIGMVPVNFASSDGRVAMMQGMVQPFPGETGPGVEGRGRNATAPSALWAMTDVSVDGQNVSGLVLNMQPGLSIPGRIVVEPVGVEAPDDLSRVRVSLAPAGSGGLMIGVGGSPTAVDRSGRFTLADVTPGKYRVNAQLSTPEANWTVKSAMLNGRDSLDFPVEIGPNDRSGEAVVTFTNRTQEVSGTLSDATGRPAPDFTIVVFPADRNYWLSSRRIRTARPDTTGRFTVANLPAGDYRIAALIDIAPGDQSDPGFLEQIVPASVVFSVREGEKKVQDIRIAGSGGSTR